MLETDMKEELEKLLATAEKQQQFAFRQQDNTAKHFYGAQVLAYKECLKLLDKHPK